MNCGAPVPGASPFSASRPATPPIPPPPSTVGTAQDYGLESDHFGDSRPTEAQLRKARRAEYRRSGEMAKDLAEGGAAAFKAGCALLFAIPLLILLVIVVFGLIFGGS